MKAPILSMLFLPLFVVLNIYAAPATTQYVATKLNISTGRINLDIWGARRWANLWEVRDTPAYMFKPCRSIFKIASGDRFTYGNLAGYLSNAVFHIRYVTPNVGICYSSVWGSALLASGTYEAFDSCPFIGLYRTDGKRLGYMDDQWVTHRFPFSISRAIDQLSVDENMSEEKEDRIIFVSTNRTDKLIAKLESDELRGSVVAVSYEIVTNDIYVYWVTRYDANKNYQKKTYRDIMAVRYGVLDGTTWQWKHTATLFIVDNIKGDRDGNFQYLQVLFTVAQRNGNIIGVVHNPYSLLLFQYNMATTATKIRRYDISLPEDWYVFKYSNAAIDSKGRIHLLGRDFTKPDGYKHRYFVYQRIDGTNIITSDVMQRLTNESLVSDLSARDNVTKLIVDEHDRPFLLYSTHYTSQSNKYLAFEAVPLCD